MSGQRLQFVVCDGNTMKDKYNSQAESYVDKQDSGFDVYYPESFTIQPGETKLVSLKIKARVVKEELCSEKTCNDKWCSDQPECFKKQKSMPYWLVPRSSIFKTKLRMANSVGIIDLNYRGPLGTPLDNIGSEPVTVEAGTRLFQICSHDLIPFECVENVESLDETVRGEGGFGSTGKN